MANVELHKAKEKGRYIGAITVKVYESVGNDPEAEACVLEPSLDYSDAMKTMLPLLSPRERAIIDHLRDEVIVSGGTLFSFMQNPDKYFKMLEDEAAAKKKSE